MEPERMLTTAAILLGIAAAGGLVMALIRFSGRDRPPSSIAMGHGLLAGAGLTLLLYAAVTEGVPPLALAATGLLIVAALIGTWINLRYHSQLRPLPIPGVLLHALVAAGGFGLLVLVLMTGEI